MTSLKLPPLFLATALLDSTEDGYGDPENGAPAEKFQPEPVKKDGDYIIDPEIDLVPASLVALGSRHSHIWTAKMTTLRPFSRSSIRELVSLAEGAYPLCVFHFSMNRPTCF